MTVYLIRRTLIAIPTLLLVTMIVFTIQHLMPGNPAAVLAGEQQDPKVIAYITKEYHLDQPLPVQYVYWMEGVLHGNLGESMQTQLPVTKIILQKIPITLELALLSMAISILIGVPAGIISAVRNETVLDYLANILALSGLSIPNFWLGILLILLVSVNLGWLPASGYISFAQHPWENIKHMIMPAFVLGSGLAAVLMRQTRSSMLETLSADFVRTARAKGLSTWVVVVKHALRNALLPVVTLGGVQLGALLSGAVVTEQVFNIPGFGKLMVSAVFSRDYIVVQGAVLFIAAAYITANLLVDVSYALLNPKIRLGGGG